jgi:Protein of unknown function (DUF3889)
MSRILTLILACMFLFSNASYAHPHQPETPAYAKWGKIAMQETKRQYPNAEITDYRHVGRNTINATTAKETFQLKLKQNQQVWNVQVNVVFETKTERTLSIVLKKLDDQQ